MKTKSRLRVVLIIISVSVTCSVATYGQKLATKSKARTVSAFPNTASVYNVKTFGAKGDGKTLDTPAINRAIDAAAKAGGGMVFFPSGSYLSVSIHLKSNITLY